MPGLPYQKPLPRSNPIEIKNINDLVDNPTTGAINENTEISEDYFCSLIEAISNNSYYRLAMSVDDWISVFLYAKKDSRLLKILLELTNKDFFVAYSSKIYGIYKNIDDFVLNVTSESTSRKYNTFMKDLYEKCNLKECLYYEEDVEEAFGRYYDEQESGIHMHIYSRFLDEQSFIGEFKKVKYFLSTFEVMYNNRPFYNSFLEVRLIP